jgi:hypothetical protein
LTNADAFRLYQDSEITGTRAWGALTGGGTRRGREAALVIDGAYTCSWKDYSSLPGRGGRFRTLSLEVK